MSCFDGWNGYDNWRLDSPSDREDIFICDRCYKEFDIDDVVEVDGQELCQDCAEKKCNEDEVEDEV